MMAPLTGSVCIQAQVAVDRPSTELELAGDTLDIEALGMEGLDVRMTLLAGSDMCLTGCLFPRTPPDGFALGSGRNRYVARRRKHEAAQVDAVAVEQPLERLAEVDQ